MGLFYRPVWGEVGRGVGEWERDGFSMEIVRCVEMESGNGTCDMWCGRFVGRGFGNDSLSGHRNVFAESITLAVRFCSWEDILIDCLATADGKYH